MHAHTSEIMYRLLSYYFNASSSCSDQPLYIEFLVEAVKSEIFSKSDEKFWEFNDFWAK